MEQKEYLNIFSQSPISIEFYDTYGYLKDVNQSCIELFGLKSLDSLKGFNLFTNPHLTEQAITDIRSGKAVRYEMKYDFDLIKQLKIYETSREGICFLDCYINPTLNDEREVTGYIVHNIEITERKKAEAELIYTEEKYRKIIDSSISGMHFYKLDANNNLLFIGANPAADRIIGISHQSLIGKNIEKAFPKLIFTEVPELYKKIAKGELGSQEFDIEYDDIPITGFYRVQVFQTEKNSITVHFTDISDRKKAELLLEQQSNELQRVNATKDKFLSIIAHDLKTPFNAIIGFADLMRLIVKHF
jgi:PAS domain S-box-containing protein